MAKLYQTTYYMQKGLFNRAGILDSIIPDHLDRPENYRYDTWWCIAKDFDPLDLDFWQSLIKKRIIPSYIFSDETKFVDPLDICHGYPKHPIGTTHMTVYWITENGQTYDIRNIIRANEQKWDELREKTNYQNMTRNQDPFIRASRTPKTARHIRRDLPESERRELARYGIHIPRLRQEDEGIQNIERTKSWKDRTKRENQYKEVGVDLCIDGETRSEHPAEKQNRGPIPKNS